MIYSITAIGKLYYKPRSMGIIADSFAAPKAYA